MVRTKLSLLCITALPKHKGSHDVSPELPLGQWFSNLHVCQNHLEGFLKHRLLGPTLRAPDSVGLGSDVPIYISNKFSGVTDATGPGDHTLTTVALV